FLDVVEFPLLLVGVEARAHRLPRHERKSRRHPAVMVDTAVGSHLKILRRAPFLGLRIVERIGETYAFDRSLRDTVKLSWRSDPDHFIERWHDVDDMHELLAQSGAIFNPGWPRQDHRIASATEVASDLLGPLEWRVHRVRPGSWEVVEVFWAAQFVDYL